MIFKLSGKLLEGDIDNEIEFIKQLSLLKNKSSKLPKSLKILLDWQEKISWEIYVDWFLDRFEESIIHETKYEVPEELLEIKKIVDKILKS